MRAKVGCLRVIPTVVDPTASVTGEREKLSLITNDDVLFSYRRRL